MKIVYDHQRGAPASELRNKDDRMIDQKHYFSNYFFFQLFRYYNIISYFLPVMASGDRSYYILHALCRGNRISSWFSEHTNNLSSIDKCTEQWWGNRQDCTHTLHYIRYSDQIYKSNAVAGGMIIDVLVGCKERGNKLFSQ